MGDINYAPLIKDMVWSYSRIKAFDDCSYRWYLKYIQKIHGKDMFFASYGSFAHKIIERFYTEHLPVSSLSGIYLQGFKQNVVGRAPNQKVFANYFKSGLEYFRSFKAFELKPLAIEKEVKFEVEGVPFIGYIDFLGEKDGELYVVDNKSRNLKARSTRAKPTKTDIELDHYLRQLYLYSIPVEKEYGKKPKYLCFNCFREGVFIQEEFSEQAFEEAKKWLIESVARITEETDFEAAPDYFKCTHLCEVHDNCDYFEEVKKR